MPESRGMHAWNSHCRAIHILESLIARRIVLRVVTATATATIPAVVAVAAAVIPDHRGGGGIIDDGEGIVGRNRTEHGYVMYYIISCLAADAPHPPPTTTTHPTTAFFFFFFFLRAKTNLHPPLPRNRRRMKVFLVVWRVETIKSVRRETNDLLSISTMQSPRHLKASSGNHHFVRS